MVITSVNNSKIKEYAKLNLVKYRKLNKCFLIEELHLIEEANKLSLIKELILLEGTELPFDFDDVLYVNSEVMRKLSTNVSLNSMIAVCEFLEDSDKLSNNIVVLDRIQDPSNLGAIFRSSFALGFNTVVLSDDCADIYNSKCLKASQGALFHLNVIIEDLSVYLPKLKEKAYQLIATDLKSTNSLESLQLNDKYAIIFGNEGGGISDDVLKEADVDCKISLANNFDSLNVVVAASICMYVLKN